MHPVMPVARPALLAFALAATLPAAAGASSLRLDAFVSDATVPELNDTDFALLDSTEPVVDTGATESAQVSRLDAGALFYDAYSYYTDPSDFGGYARTKPIEFVPDKVQSTGELVLDVTRADASFTSLDYRISNAELALEDSLFTSGSAELFMSIRVRAPGEADFTEVRNSFALLTIESGVFDFTATGVFTDATGTADASFETGSFADAFTGDPFSGVLVDFSTLNGSFDISDFALAETYEVKYLWSATVTGGKYANAQFYDPLGAGSGFALSDATLAALGAGVVTPTPVPLPAAVWSLVAGVLGLGLLRRLWTGARFGAGP